MDPSSETSKQPLPKSFPRFLKSEHRKPTILNPPPKNCIISVSKSIPSVYTYTLHSSLSHFVNFFLHPTLSTNSTLNISFFSVLTTLTSILPLLAKVRNNILLPLYTSAIRETCRCSLPRSGRLRFGSVLRRFLLRLPPFALIDGEGESQLSLSSDLLSKLAVLGVSDCVYRRCY